MWKCWFWFLYALMGFIQRESKCHIVKRGAGSVANRLITIFHLCNTHPGYACSFSSACSSVQQYLIVDDWLKRSRLNLLPEAHRTSDQRAPMWLPENATPLRSPPNSLTQELKAIILINQCWCHRKGSQDVKKFGELDWFK